MTGLQQGRPSGSTIQGLRTWSEQEDAVQIYLYNYIYKIYTYINEKDALAGSIIFLLSGCSAV
jgi:hypothetical protein